MKDFFVRHGDSFLAVVLILGLVGIVGFFMMSSLEEEKYDCSMVSEQVALKQFEICSKMSLPSSRRSCIEDFQKVFCQPKKEN